MSDEMFEIRMERPARNAIDDGLIDWLEAELDAADGRPVLFTEVGYTGFVDCGMFFS